MVQKRKKLPKVVEESKRRAAGMASATKGRARTFKNKKKEDSKKKCREKNVDD